MPAAHPFTLYTHPWSRGRSARWMLEECDIPYDTVVLDYGTTMKAPEYLAINPMGKVPALRHGNQIVTEVAAIVAYLADLFPALKLAPAVGSPARGSYYRWLFFSAGPLEAAATGRALGLLAPPDKASMVGYGTYDAVLNTLEQAVGQQPYLCGDHFTAADLYVGAHLNWGMQFGSIERRPAFERYVQPLVARAAYLRAFQLDEALGAQLKGHG